MTILSNLLFPLLSWRNSVRILEISRSNAAPKLKVTPVLAFPGPLDEMVSFSESNDSVENSFGRRKTYLGIEIVNEGYSSQRIIEAGFVDAKGARYRINDWYWIDAPDRRSIDFDQSCQGFPIKLQATEAAGIYLRLPTCSEGLVFHEKVYVELDSGQLLFGVSAVVNDMANQIRACTSREE